MAGAVGLAGRLGSGSSGSGGSGGAGFESAGAWRNTRLTDVLSAFGYGFFFGGIVIPCNPGLIALFFARSLVFADSVLNLLNFLACGVGIGAPLSVLAAVSDRWSKLLC